MSRTARVIRSPALIHDRDRRLGVSTARKRQNRADIPDPEVVPGANSWQSGRTVQTRLDEMDFNRLAVSPAAG